MSVATQHNVVLWLNEEVKRRDERVRTKPGVHVHKLQVAAARWVLPRLLRILEQNPGQQVEVLAPLVHAMLRDHAYANTGGDPCDCEHLEASIDETVAVIVGVLEKACEQDADPTGL